jgi:hypothetical protein
MGNSVAHVKQVPVAENSGATGQFNGAVVSRDDLPLAEMYSFPNLRERRFTDNTHHHYVPAHWAQSSE